MARIEFGHTWWGKRWLEALSNIDYSNRLPRGKRYARNGSVTSIDIEGPKVSAKVKGRQPSPYSVSLTLWTFKKAEREAMVRIVKGNPYYLSQLGAHILPPELEEEAEAAGIRLFPKSWKELGMRCSCPDWAVPCKHLAAVVYIIANEIDKNPFLVFRMHGLDLLSEVGGGAGEEAEEPIAGIETFLAYTPEEYNYYREHLEHIDLSAVPDLYPAISQLLTEFPLFYLKKDFKEILLEAYRRSSKAIKRHVKNLDLQEEPPKTLYSSCGINIYKGKYRFAGSLKKGQQEIRFDSDNMGPFIEYLRLLSAGDLSAYPPVLSFLVMLHSFTLKLLEQKAAIPDILSIRRGSYVIRWIPALFNEETSRIFETFVEALPKEIVRYGKTPLEHREQVLFLISFLMRHYLREFEASKKAEEEPITALFFSGAEYSPKKFEERENAQTIHLWLGRFFIRPVDYRPVIHIEESSEERFRFEIRVSNRRDEEELPIPFRDFLEKDQSETMPLLRDLSLLATYLPTVNDFLRNREPIVVEGEAFLERWFSALPALKTLGVHTVVPKALREAFMPHISLKMGAPAGSSEKVVSYTSLKEMLQFDWNIAAGERFIDPQELFELKGKYGRFVRYKDMFLELDEKQLESLARRMEKAPSPSPLDLLKTGLTGLFDGAPVETDGEVEKLFSSLLTPPEVEVPSDLRAELRPYQLRGYRWLYHNHRIGLGSVAADDMGLGKTVQVIALLQQLKDEKVVSPKKPVLIIVPASLMTNWQREIERFAPGLQSDIYHGSEREMQEGTEVLITTYSLVRRDIEELKKTRWSVAVIDEAQNIKNSTSAQTKAVKSIKADHRIAMTGTPVENRLLDYWSIIDYAMKGYLGSKAGFKEGYAIPIERYRDREALERFRKLTSPLILRRLKTDKSIIKDLPEKVITNRFPTLTKEQAVLYQQLVENTDQWLADTEGIGRSGIVFKLMTGLKQICCHPRLYSKQGTRAAEASGKSAALLELLQTIAERGEKALIFTQFAEMGEILKEMIEKHLEVPCLFFHGGSSKKAREEMVDLFQNDPNYRFMVLSIKAGGVGLNLTAANHVIHYDLWWNPAVENQATDRAFRIGQRKDVTVYRLITRGTFEEKINGILEAKKELADLTVSDGEQWLTKMSTGDLKELIELS
ncbi:MAG: SNF2-related protein, partial [Spirochaetaceae bacterium]